MGDRRCFSVSAPREPREPREPRAIDPPSAPSADGLSHDMASDIARVIQCYDMSCIDRIHRHTIRWFITCQPQRENTDD